MNYDSLIRKIEYVFQGRYEYLERLGRGGMGTVCLVRGRDLVHGRYALKIISKHSPENQGIDVYTEIHALEGLNHPGIVSIYEAVEDADNVYIIQEFINGKTLAELRDDFNTVDAISEDTVMLWMIDVADALAYLHSCGIVHRDIKPGNIMVDSNGSARLIDFGLARRISTLQRSNGSTVGSAPYSPLERLQGEADGVKTDVYAFGAAFYSLLRRRIPSVSGREINTLRSGNRSVKPYYMSAYRSMIGDLNGIRNEGLRNLIRGCVDIDPDRRIGDFNTIRYRLRSMQHIEAVHTERVKTGKRSYLGMIALLIIGVMLSGLGIIQMKRDYDNRYQSILDSANEAYAAADYTASEKAANEAIDFDSDNEAGYVARYRAETAYAYEMNDDDTYERLISEIEADRSRVSALKDDLNTAAYLANAYYETGHPDKAAAELDGRDELDDDQMMLLGQAWYESGKNKKALSCMERISGEVPQKYYLEGLIEQDKNQQQAIDSYKKVLETEDAEGGFTDLKRKALSQIAQIYIDSGEYSRASDYISSAMDDNPALRESAKLNIMMMDCLYKAGDYRAAIDQSDLVINRFSNPGAYAVKCSSQIEAGSSPDALRTIDDWEQTYPEDARPHVQKTIIYNRLAGSAKTDRERMDTYPDFIRVYEQEREWLISHNEMNDEFRSLEGPYMEARNILSQMEAGL